APTFDSLGHGLKRPPRPRDEASSPVVWRIDAGSQLGDRGCERCVELSWQAPLELPNERDRAVALVTHIGGRAKAPERSIGGAQSGEEHDVRPAFALPDVPLTHHAGGGSRGLALPMDQLRADRVVAVAGRRREATDALIERESKDVRLRLRFPPDTG